MEPLPKRGHLNGRVALSYTSCLKRGLFNLRQEIVEGDRRHVAVQPGEFSGPRRRQKVLSCREHLAEFYEGRPELLKRELRALLRFKMRDFIGFPPVQYL